MYRRYNIKVIYLILYVTDISHSWTGHPKRMNLPIAVQKIVLLCIDLILAGNGVIFIAALLSVTSVKNT